MPLTIIIEDGTGVDDANSFASMPEARDYATMRGIELTEDDAEVSAMLIKAMDYLQSQDYSGTPVYADHVPFPRNGLDSLGIAKDAIPKAIKNAQCQLVLEQHNGVDIMPTIDNRANGGFVVREKIDVLETQYSEKVGTSYTPIMPNVDWLLKPLLSNLSQFRTVRI